MAGRKVITESGNIARVWSDPINRLIPFKDQYPELFDICNTPECTIKQVLNVDSASFFRRRLTPMLSEQWGVVLDTVNKLPLTDKENRVVWNLNQNGKFSTKSVYKWSEKTLNECHYKWIWKAKIPLKIKKIMWQMFQSRLPTLDNMAKRNIPANGSCAVCVLGENAHHVFFGCFLARFTWNAIRETFSQNWNPLS